MNYDLKGFLIIIVFILVLWILSEIGGNDRNRELDPDIEIHQQYGGR